MCWNVIGLSRCSVVSFVSLCEILTAENAKVFDNLLMNILQERTF